MNDIYVVGVGMTPFGRLLERSLYDLVEEAVDLALKDAGAATCDVGAAYYGTLTNGMLQGQTAIPGPIAMRRLGIEGVPVFSVENACATGSSAFNLATLALRAGQCDIALAVGAEKMNVADKAKMFAVFDGGWDVSTVEQNKETLLAMGEGIVPPPGSMSERPYSVFMDVYAAICRNHMTRYGTTQRQIAAVAAKNHQHSVHNPLAQFQQAFSIEEVLASPPIAYPLTTLMCSPISDGAAAVLLCNAAGLKRLQGADKRAIRVLASVVQTGTTRSLDEPEKIIACLAAKKAYEQAGVAPGDVDVAEVHDASAIGEILNAESLLLVPFGEGGPAAERGDFTVGGKIPINPSGGLESKGHPIGATGLGQIHELVTQLRGEAGKRQVEGARIAIQENGGGLFGIEEAVVAVNILAKQ
ncbi:thiolase family protein [Pseudomonas aeruginosa]|nr:MULTISPECIES: thiolase family protein [Pseudomonadaceae]SAJ30859.1 acetyl-CoA acetyltransferase [Enterobacter cloacae]ELQ8316638.1 thiolase family protein [Pseudomonas aeruginosa]MBG6795672.1 thiolase family protein [Pseudomonas aeruginosa]MBG6799193.1 thiolase family protein [Pseudomonas aeruginosa]MBI7168346.1 thiolase family protein [Pseudomonas aeruginosa]